MFVLNAAVLFSNFQEFPIFNDAAFDPASPAHIPSLRLRYVDIGDRTKCFVIFISHRWLSPAKDSTGHPDRRKDNPKFRMLKSAIDKLQESTLKGLRVMLWVDYCCLEQVNGIEQLRGVDSLPSYIERCDAMLTPVVEAEGAEKWWGDDASAEDYPPCNLVDEYASPAWQEYKSRGWCRTEIFVAGNAPARVVNPYFTLNGASGRRKDRAHFLYGEREMAAGEPPLVLPPLRNKYFRDHVPMEGRLTKPEDAEKIRRIVAAVEVREEKVGFEGERNASGRPHGHGVMYYDTGSDFTGVWKDGVWARGTYSFVDGRVYEGTFHRSTKANGRLETNGTLFSATGELVMTFANKRLDCKELSVAVNLNPSLVELTAK